MSRSRSDDSVEQRRDEPDDDTTLIPSAAGSITAWAPGTSDPETTTDDPALAGRDDSDTYEGDGGWWDEGLISLLILSGAVLFLIPEPATSALGIVLLTLGVAAWIVDAAT